MPFLASGGYIVWLDGLVDGGRRLIALHLLVVFLLGLAVLPVAAACTRMRWGRLLLATLLAVGGFSLLVVYAGNAVSNLFWQDTLTFKLFRYFFLELHWLRDDLPVPRRWVALALALLALASVVFGLTVSKGLSGVLDRLVASRRGRRKALGSLAAGAAIVLAAIAATVVWRPHFSFSSQSEEAVEARFLARRLLRQEPLIGLFMSDTGHATFGEYWRGRQVAETERAIRADYPKDLGFERKNVVLIICDALRPDHMGVYGYHRETTPFLSELYRSKSLLRVETAFAGCPSSACGVSTILSSKKLASILPENFALHEVLADQGYETHFLISGDHDWGGLRAFYGDELTRIFQGTDSRRYAATDDRVLLEALEETGEFRGVPAFFYFHVMAPHVWAVRWDDENRFQPADGKAWLMRRGIAPDAEAAVNYYDNGVAQADATIRRIFERLQAKGYLDDAMVVITSDHGESLGEKRKGLYGRRVFDPNEGIYGHFPDLYQEYVSVPLLLWDPGNDGVDPEFGRHIDVAPTILDRLGLPVPSSWDGTSLLAPGGISQVFMRADFRDASYALVVVRGNRIYKYIYYSSARWQPREELYELTADPGELDDLIDRVDPRLVEELRGKLAAEVGAPAF